MTRALGGVGWNEAEEEGKEAVEVAVLDERAEARARVRLGVAHEKPEPAGEEEREAGGFPPSATSRATSGAPEPPAGPAPTQPPPEETHAHDQTPPPRKERELQNAREPDLRSFPLSTPCLRASPEPSQNLWRDKVGKTWGFLPSPCVSPTLDHPPHLGVAPINPLCFM